MSERLRGAEHHSSHGEIEKAAAERLKQLEKRSESRSERSNEVERAREQIKRVERVDGNREAGTKHEGATKRPVLTPSLNYTHTMASLRHRMKPTARSFSKFIHTPVVENTSELLGKTVLRPSVTLGATSCAVLLTAVLYLYARFYGFPLRSSVVWIGLLLGAIIGILVEAIVKTARRGY